MAILDDAIIELRLALRDAFQNYRLQADFTWEIGGRAVSEVGGRLIEDFVVGRIPQCLRERKQVLFDSVEVRVPPSGRNHEDFSATFRRGSDSSTLLVDIKGHNQLTTGSRPNLSSIRKCRDLYGSELRTTEELVIFFCRYMPNPRPGARERILCLEIVDDSFSEQGIFLLRNLSQRNLFKGNIGQLQLAREDQIVLETRTRADFIALLNEIETRPRSK